MSDGKGEALTKSPTVFFDCRGCGWSCGTNNDEFAVEFITERIRDHLKHDSRHLGLPRLHGATYVWDGPNTAVRCICGFYRITDTHERAEMEYLHHIPAAPDYRQGEQQ